MNNKKQELFVGTRTIVKNDYKTKEERDQNFAFAWNTFNNRVIKSGKLKALKDKNYFVSRSDKKNLKHKKAVKQLRKKKNISDKEFGPMIWVKKNGLPETK